MFWQHESSKNSSLGFWTNSQPWVIFREGWVLRRPLLGFRDGETPDLSQMFWDLWILNSEERQMIVLFSELRKQYPFACPSLLLSLPSPFSFLKKILFTGPRWQTYFWSWILLWDFSVGLYEMGLVVLLRLKGDFFSRLGKEILHESVL